MAAFFCLTACYLFAPYFLEAQEVIELMDGGALSKRIHSFAVEPENIQKHRSITYGQKLSTVRSTGIYACGDSSCGIGQKSISNVSMKQEVMNGIFVHKL